MAIDAALSLVSFPTHVGVFPNRDRAIKEGMKFPHACGGVSELGAVKQGAK